MLPHSAHLGPLLRHVADGVALHSRQQPPAQCHAGVAGVRLGPKRRRGGKQRLQRLRRRVGARGGARLWPPQGIDERQALQKRQSSVLSGARPHRCNGLYIVTALIHLGPPEGKLNRGLELCTAVCVAQHH